MLHSSGSQHFWGHTKHCSCVLICWQWELSWGIQPPKFGLVFNLHMNAQLPTCWLAIPYRLPILLYHGIPVLDRMSHALLLRHSSDKIHMYVQQRYISALMQVFILNELSDKPSCLLLQQNVAMSRNKVWFIYLKIIYWYVGRLSM